MRSKRLILITVALLTSLVSGCAGAALAQTTPEEDQTLRTLSVTGSGRAVMQPDLAYVNVGVHSEGQSAARAVADNSRQTQAVIGALQDFGIAEKDIQTTNFSIYPQPQYDNEGKPTGEITYIVDNTVYVTVRDITKIGELLDAVVQAGANSINGIQFDVEDKTAALSAAREAAVANAEATAQELAKASGVTLGEVHSISSYSSFPAPVSDFGGGIQRLEAAASVPISPGQMFITVEVSVVYTIR